MSAVAVSGHFGIALRRRQGIATVHRVPETAHRAAGLRQVIESLDLSNTGKFIAYDGKEIAW